MLLALLLASALHAAPEFSKTAFDGQKVDLKSLRGHVVLIDFWASWCAPCLLQIPKFVETQKKYPELKIIGISMDDDEEPVRTLLKKFHVNYPVVMGDEKIGELFGGILGLPVILLLDRKGEIVKRLHEAPSEKELRELLTQK